MVKEGINFKGIEKAFRIKLERVKPCVEIERKRAEEIKPAKVSANCPERLKALAERLVAIQNEKGELKKEYIDKTDYTKLAKIQKTKYSMGIVESVSFMIDNAYYVDDNMITARHIFKILTEIDDVYNKYYEEKGFFPLSEFSDETNKYISKNRLGLSKEKFVRMILETYKPEYAKIEMQDGVLKEVKDESVKANLINRWIKLKPYVEIERKRAEEIKPAKVSENCPENFKALAEKLVAIQNEKGEITKEYIGENDYFRLTTIKSSTYKMGVKEAVSFIVDNAYYVSNEVLTARKILKFLTEFDDVYGKFYEDNKVIPLNEFSHETINFFHNLRIDLSREEIAKTLLEVYKPEYANVSIMKKFLKSQFAGDAKENLIERWKKLKPLVFVEYERIKEKKLASVSANCPEDLKDLAQKMVNMQNEKGEIKREYFEDKDYGKLRNLKSSKYKMGIKEAVSLMVDNAYYVDNDVLNARQILKFLKKFEAIYNEFYEMYNGIPLNKLGGEDYAFVLLNRNWNMGLTREEMIRSILEVYIPEFANIEMFEERNRQLLTNEEIAIIVSDLKTISMETDKGLNVIFASEYETYFKELCEKLKSAGYNFNTFVAQYTDLNYTRCFRCNDIVSVVKKMCQSYKKRYRTTVGICDSDPYLWRKIAQAKIILGDYTIKGVLEKMGISADNDDTSNNVISQEELEIRERMLFSKIEKLYPDKHIPLNSITNDVEIYNELLFLVKRRRFFDINEYLESKGYSRDSWSGGGNSVIFLSERDLLYYGFLDGCETAEDEKKMFASYNIELADPYESIGNYRRLAYVGLDALAYKDITAEVDKEVFKFISKE